MRITYGGTGFRLLPIAITEIAGSNNVPILPRQVNFSNMGKLTLTCF
jgi:hypothetical protein